jgi:hypothetical protein
MYEPPSARYIARVFRTIVAATPLLLASCETCGDPAEPVIDFLVTLERPTNAGDFVHVAMLNSLGNVVDAYAHRVDANTWSYSLGHCDGDRQQSGQFKIIAWLNATASYDEQEPAPGDPQAMDLIDVHCGGDGCYAARDAQITIR